MLACVVVLAVEAAAANPPTGTEATPGQAADSVQARVAARFAETAQEHLKAARYQEAIDDFKAALAFDPNLAAARRGLEEAQAKSAAGGGPKAGGPKAGGPKTDGPKTGGPKTGDDRPALRALYGSARSALEEGRYDRAAEEFDKVLLTVQSLAKTVDVVAIEAEARQGLRSAREGLLRGPARSEPPDGPKTAGGKRSDAGAEEKLAALEDEARAAADEALRDVTRLMRPQVDILTKPGVPSKMPDILRRQREGMMQIISGASDDAEDDEANNLVRAKLLKKATMKFENQTFEDAVEYIRVTGDVNIMVDPAVAPMTTSVKGISAHNLELGQLLRWVLRFQKLDYKITGGVVFISNRTGLAGKPVTAWHDIADLAVHLRDFRSWMTNGGIVPSDRQPRAAGAGEAMEGEKPDEFDRTREGEGWVKFLRENIAPGTWGEGAVAQNTIAYRNGKLVVTNTPDVQDQIRELLASFRKARAIQVAILARFIEINEDFLDELGVKFSGLAGANAEFGVVDTGTGSTFFRAGLSPSHEVPLATTGYKESAGLIAEFGFLKQWQVQMIVSAVRKQRKGNILTAPRVTCFNGQRAFLTVSTRRNFVRTYDSNGNPEIGQVNDGLVFEVQPVVSADRRYITLELIPQVNMVGQFQEFKFRRTTTTTTTPTPEEEEDTIQLPEVTTRQVMTTVSVPDGGTLMIGGLAQGTEAEGSATMPILGELPLIKHLVTTRRRIDSRNNLVILVTAHVIQQEED